MATEDVESDDGGGNIDEKEQCGCEGKSAWMLILIENYSHTFLDTVYRLYRPWSVDVGYDSHFVLPVCKMVDQWASIGAKVIHTDSWKSLY